MTDRSDCTGESAAGGGFDCFNEDLSWILNKLVVRTGGVAGVISGQLLGEHTPALLAVVDATSARLSFDLNSRAAAVQPPATPADHDSPVLSHTLLTLTQPNGSKLSYRVLQLALSPANGVKVVATVAKDSRLGFKLLEDLNARRLYPVLSRYVRLWWAHRVERTQARALKAVIDSSDLAIMLLNRNARLLFANAPAQSLLSAADGFCSAGHTILPSSQSHRRDFQTAVQRALDGNLDADVSTAAAESPAFPVPRDNAKRDLIVSVLPLRVPALDSEDPAVIVYGLDPDCDLADLLEPVCAIYKLTCAESRLVGRLIGGNTLAEAAERINIRPHTARTYLKSIFLKTRTHRQADLVRVMLSSTLRTAARRHGS